MAFILISSLFFVLENVYNPKLGVVMAIFCVVTTSCMSGVLHTRCTLDLFYHCASLQLKNLEVLNNSEPVILSINF